MAHPFSSPDDKTDDPTVIQKRIAMGKEALVQHEIREAFHRLFIPALEDARAKRLLLRLLNHYHRVRLLTMEDIEGLQVVEKAKEGHVVAQYVMGRFHQQVKPDKDSISKAKYWFDLAKKAGLGDAFASDALLVLDGYYGPVDMKKYHSMMDEGLSKGFAPDYCSLPYFRMLRAMVYGEHDVASDPQKAISSIKETLGFDESDNIDLVDPAYYKLLGDAYKQMGDKKTAGDYYLKAVDMGYYECCNDYALLKTPNETFTHKAWQHWEQMNMTGCRCKDPRSYISAALFYETSFEDLPDDEKPRRMAEVKEALETAYALGDELAAFFLGYNYYVGDQGFEENMDEAWRWFNNGAYWEDGLCFSMAAKMVEEGKAPGKHDQTWFDYFYLQGLRRGDESVLDKVVDIYRAGRLIDFAQEIETLYLPKSSNP